MICRNSSLGIWTTWVLCFFHSSPFIPIYNRLNKWKFQPNRDKKYIIAQDYANFQQNLRKLSSDPNHNVFEVEDWDEVKQRFREIAIQLYNETTTVNTNVKIPGGKDNGTVIRITFDNVTNDNNWC